MDNDSQKIPDDIDIEPIDFESLDLILERIKQFKTNRNWLDLWQAISVFCKEVGEKFELAQEEKQVLASLAQIMPLSSKVQKAFDQFFEKIKKFGPTHWSPYADLIAAIGLEYLHNQEQKQQLAVYLKGTPLCDPICRQFALNGLHCNLPTFASAFFATAFSKNKILSDFAKENPSEIPTLFQNLLLDAQSAGSDAHYKFMENVITKIDTHRLSMVIGPIIEMNEIEIEKKNQFISQLKLKLQHIKTEEFYKYVDLMKQFGQSSLLNIRVARRRIIEILESIEPKGFRFLGTKKKDKKDEIIAEVEGFFDWLNKTVSDVITSIDEQVGQLERENRGREEPSSIMPSGDYHSESVSVKTDLPDNLSIDKSIPAIKEFYEAMAGAIQEGKSAEEILSDIILFATDLRINLKELNVDVSEIENRTFPTHENQEDNAQTLLELDIYQQTIEQLQEKIKTVKTDVDLGLLDLRQELNALCEYVEKTDSEVEKILKNNRVDKPIRSEAGTPLLKLFGAVKTNTDKLIQKFEKLAANIDTDE